MNSTIEKLRDTERSIARILQGFASELETRTDSECRFVVAGRIRSFSKIFEKPKLMIVENQKERAPSILSGNGK